MADQTPLYSGKNRRLIRLLASITLACVIYDLGALILLHLLQPGLNPLRRAVSNYALGPYGFLLGTILSTAPLMLGSLAAALHYSFVRPVIRSRWALLPSAVAAILFIVVAVFHKSSVASETIVTRDDWIHIVSALIAVLWVHLVMVRLSFHFKVERAWRATASRQLTLALLALAVFLAPTVARTGVAPIAGAMQRLDMVLIMLWVALAALHLRSLAASALVTYQTT